MHFGFVLALLAQSLLPLGDPREQRRGSSVDVPAIQAPTETERLNRSLRESTVTERSTAIEQPIDPATYVCGQGDLFELNFWGAQNAVVRAAVDVEGRIFLPRMGYVKIAGRTLVAARRDVEQTVARYFPKLRFDLALIEPRRFLVHIVGNVTRPGTQQARAVDRVAGVLSDSGGITAVGSRRRIEIERRDGSRIPVDLQLYELTGELRHNPFVLDGDIIHVPIQETAATAAGAVARPAKYELVETKDVEELLKLAGGLVSTATRQLPVRLQHRGPLEQVVETKIAFPPGEGLPTVKLVADDVVTFPSVGELQRSVILVGAIQGAPTNPEEANAERRVLFVEGETVRTLLDRLGGVTPLADLKRAFLQRHGGEVLGLDLEALLVRREFREDRPLQMGDTLVVPYQRRNVVVEGAVFHPGSFQYNPNYTIAQYIALAGGESRFASSRDNVRVVSAAGATTPFSDALRANPGDTVVVPERSFSRAEVVQLIFSAVGLVVSGAALVIAASR